VVLAADEIVTEIQVPAPSSSAKQAFTKIAIRKSIDFAVVSIASVIDRQPGTVKVNDARIVLGAVAPVPYRATAAEDFIKGKSLTEQ
jgi:CO/xanthine dehydrogenase FAD-binding subunit